MSASPWPSVMQLLAHPSRVVADQAQVISDLLLQQGLSDMLEQPLEALVQTIQTQASQLAAEEFAAFHVILYHLRAIDRMREHYVPPAGSKGRGAFGQ
jgi:hypothetical protein